MIKTIWVGWDSFFLVEKYMGLKNISGFCSCGSLFTGCEVFKTILDRWGWSKPFGLDGIHFFLLKCIWVWRIFQVFVHAAVYLLVVKFLKQFQIDEVDQNHLDWMGFVFSCWKVYGFEEYFRFLFMLLFIYWLWSFKNKFR